MDIVPIEDKYKAIKEEEQGDKILLKKKYGVIRITGENFLREVSWDTYNYLKNLPSDFKGTVEIQELKLTVPVNQIVKIEEKEIEEVKSKGFTNLPTETVFLDENFDRLISPKPIIEKKYDIYYIATCHYVVVNGEKQYCLAPEQIPYLVTMVRDEDSDYPHYIKEVTRYGHDIREIQKEQEERHSKRH